MSVDPPPGLPLPDPPDPATPASAAEPEWPAGPDLTLAYNRMGSFDIDLAREHMHLDPAALDVFDLRPDEYDGHMAVASRVPAEELERLDTLIRRALENGKEIYGAYFRIRCRDGSRRWLHTQGRLVRDAEGDPYRVI
ncbi:PAS domain-containing protein, partial [Streptomyces niveus]